MKKITATAITAALALGALAGSASLASAETVDGRADGYVRVQPGFALDHLVESSIPGRGGPLKVLVLASRPDVQRRAGAVFFVYDPVRAAQAGPLWLSGDTVAASVDTWREVAFSYPSTAQQRLEVRYGDPADASAAVVVASVTRCR
ncbi:hypothetical protein ACIQWR_37780 [Streptomyces sp. NPDC098789]|uniref:hypothetical protein n=1 Tax=Streptomyces sp. NPDC098789 TaxID=3366098 RepID=UPI0038023122